MRRVAFCLFTLLCTSLTAACGLSVDESCQIVCDVGALCQPSGPSVESCVALCKDQAQSDEYADSIEQLAECYEDQKGYYDDPKGVCLAREGGACSVTQ